MDEYKVGDITDGVVTGIKPYGIFVKLNNSYSGLIHISEISNDFVRDINEITNVGDNIKVRIIEVDNDKKELKLSIKPLKKNNYKYKRRIIEVGSGFTILKDNLSDWIDEKIKEIK